MSTERGDVWLAVAGMVMHEGKILAVKKSYGATKGLWTLPAGFVNADETVDMAAAREVKEETGIEAVPEAVLCVRSGVLRKGKSDTMIVFRLRYEGGLVQKCEREIDILEWKTAEELIADPDSTEFLVEMLRALEGKAGLGEQNIEFSRDYGYSAFKMFI